LAFHTLVQQRQKNRIQHTCNFKGALRCATTHPTEFILTFSISLCLCGSFNYLTQVFNIFMSACIMSFNQLISAVSQLSHEDKLRLINFLLLEVAKEEGCNLELADHQELENLLLEQLAATEAVVSSPYDAHEAAQTLSDMLTAQKEKVHD
jgi:hypothetical protein